jgi:hypothetical protein
MIFAPHPPVAPSAARFQIELQAAAQPAVGADRGGGILHLRFERRACAAAAAQRHHVIPPMAFRCIAIIVSLLWLAGCDGGRGQAPSAQSRLESAVASGAASFDFAADPAFAWDRMYVFGCYSSRASVEKALGFSWPDFGTTTIESADSVVLVVFVRNGKVVGWYEQPRSIELAYLANDKGYTPSEAVFDVDRSTGKVELKSRTPATAPATRPAG